MPSDRWRCDWNLDALSDAELEALMPLSAKHEAAIAAGHEPAWTPAEVALLAELGAKAGGRAVKLARRVARLEDPLVDGRLAPWLRTMAIEVATELGVDPEAVIAETTILLTEAAAAGALASPEALEAFLAQQTAWLPSVLAADAINGEA